MTGGTEGLRGNKSKIRKSLTHNLGKERKNIRLKEAGQIMQSFEEQKRKVLLDQLIMSL